MNIFSAYEKSDNFEEKIRELLGKEEPEFLWVDNCGQNHRFWKLYMFYLQEGKLQKEAFLFMNKYSLFIEKGSCITEDTAGWRVEGNLVYGYEGRSVELNEAWISAEGVISFSVMLEDMAAWGAEIRYVCEEYDENLERNLFLGLRSPVFSFDKSEPFHIHFFPAEIAENRMVAEKDIMAMSYLQTRYSERISIKVPKDFSFELAVSADVNGYRDYYFTPSGTVEVAEGQLCMPGLSGTEYMQLKNRVSFSAGKQAYFGEEKTEGECTTSYVAFPESVYYTQPQNMGFYTENAKNIYSYANMPGVELKECAFPMLLFSGMEEHQEKVVQIENNYLVKARKRYIEGELCQKERKSTTDSYAFTRSGMYAAYNSSQLIWLQMVALRNLSPGLAFTDIQSKLWFALLSSELFVVLTDLQNMAQVPYSISSDFLERAKRKGYTDTEKLQNLIGKTFFTIEECKYQVEQSGASWNELLQDACCHFNLNIAGWEFTCTPYKWKENKTLSIIKLAENESLAGYMEKPNLWSLPLSEDEYSIAKHIFSNITNMMDESQMDYLRYMLIDNNWKGTAFFQSGVDMENLPKELAFLMKGIDKDKFYATYVCFPFISNKEQNGAEGNALIFYEDKSRLELEEYQDYTFRVKELKLDIRENKICDFGVKAELVINRLFEFKTSGRAEEGESSSLIFNGTYQENETGGYYGFAMDKPVNYYVEAGGIECICIDSATLKTEGDSSRFVLGGYMVLSSDFEIDIFSYNKLPFAGLVIEMKAQEHGYEFQVDYSSLVLIPENGELREDSFGIDFPANLTHIVFGKNHLITDEGYLPLKLKGYENEEILGNNWTGFVWRIEMGNLGSLAETTKLTLELLVAFRPQEENSRGIPIACCGIKISSMLTSDSYSLPLQGILSLGFDAIELKKDEKYYFRFRNFSLSILGKRFPESNNDMYLIGDENGNLGWYGAVEGKKG